MVAEGGAVLGVLPEEGGAETDPAAGVWGGGGGGGRGAEEELFTLDGVTAPHSASTLSDEEREQEDSEPDEGVHMWVPGESDKYRMRNRHERGPEVSVKKECLKISNNLRIMAVVFWPNCLSSGGGLAPRGYSLAGSADARGRG